ncbi:pectate lyase [Sphingomonas crusticola]|uniref:pectate lyase n=1 Tax=Sphingomonas crusticola TaxID=1697973 RepID=UPI001966E69D|nr:pectate lyase [Sphingomonas crusticola]
MAELPFLRRMARGVPIAIAAIALIASAPVHAASRTQILGAMKRATTFMVETVSTNGGYVWSYLPDKSRRWGELEATPSMIWVQPPGTATMGNLFLDAYHASGDEYYYAAAEKAAAALIWGERPDGGWNYFIDFAGPAATRHWYDTIGSNAWRMEEFQHYWGNATFDDDGTSEAMQFLLRLYVEKRDPKYRPAVDKAIRFVLASQYANGGWPQRWPLKHEFVHHGLADYTSYITFNDDVTAKNVEFLLLCYRALGDERLLDAVRRGMNVYLQAQQAAPQPGWALQYTPDDMRPAAARSYEPRALATHATAQAVEQLFRFYRLTGDPRYLARVPEALDWLESTRTPVEVAKGPNIYPTFIEIGTGKPLYLHRRGSNVVNGEYYADHDPAATLGHYSSFRTIDVPALRAEYARLKVLPQAELAQESPLLSSAPLPLPRYFVNGSEKASDLNLDRRRSSADALVKGLNSQGWWPTELTATSHPYSGDGSPEVVPGDYRSTRVGDATDTSPYPDPKPVIGISTGTYIVKMAELIRALDDAR